MEVQIEQLYAVVDSKRNLMGMNDISSTDIPEIFDFKGNFNHFQEVKQAIKKLAVEPKKALMNVKT